MAIPQGLPSMRWLDAAYRGNALPLLLTSVCIFPPGRGGGCEKAPGPRTLPYLVAFGKKELGQVGAILQRETTTFRKSLAHPSVLYIRHSFHCKNKCDISKSWTKCNCHLQVFSIAWCEWSALAGISIKKSLEILAPFVRYPTLGLNAMNNIFGNISLSLVASWNFFQTKMDSSVVEVVRRTKVVMKLKRTFSEMCQEKSLSGNTSDTLNYHQRTI